MGRTTFDQASQVTPVAPNVYRVHLDENWTIGAVPHGGYSASTILRAASHFLRSRGQQDTVSAHWEFPSRLEVGPAVIIIEDVKPGRGFSTLHATMYQGDLTEKAPFFTSKSRKSILAYLINTNEQAQEGLTLKTDWELLPPPLPVDMAKLARGEDPNWTLETTRIPLARRKSVTAPSNAEFYFPRVPGRRGLEDNWMRLRSGERWTMASLPFLADMLPIVVEAWRGTEDAPFDKKEQFWYPTLALNLDFKKPLPKEGVEWLFLRTEMRTVSKGRFDLLATILDESGDLVAVASHVNLVLSFARNQAKRGEKNSKL